MPAFEPMLRTLLILEDDPFWQDLLENKAKSIASGLKSQFLNIEIRVLKARSISKALQIMEEYQKPIDIVSVDINLTDSDLDDRAGDAPIGGFGFLEYLKNKPRILSLIVSGEQKVNYPVRAFQTYGVLNYIPKTTVNKVYAPSVEAAVWYLTALDAVSQDLPQLELRDIGLAQVAWQNALSAAQRAEIHRNQFPQQLDALIQSHRNLYMHPETNLPIGKWMDEKLKRFVVRGASWNPNQGQAELRDWTILRVRLEGFANFVRDFASQKQAMMVIFVRSIETVMQDYQESLVFMGQLDRDLSHGEVDVFLLLNHAKVETIKEISEQIDSHLLQSIPKIYQNSDLHTDFEPSAYPLLPRFKTWYSFDNHDFSDLHILQNTLNRGDNNE